MAASTVLLARVRRAAPAAALAVAVAACSSGPVTRTDIGTVADLSAQQVCLVESGLALQRCFTADPALVRGVRVGECVQITATLGFGRTTVRRATAIEPLSADARAGCAAAPRP